MIVKECAFLRTGNDTCNLFPQKEPIFRFIECEKICISQCPYKLYKTGVIDEEELHKQIIAIFDKNRNEIS